MKKCFIVSPIGEEGSDVRKSADQLFKHVINPICAENNLEAIRLDHINSAGHITLELIEHIKSADLVIADLTGHNPNVFFEIGYRTALNLPIIHLRKKGEILPFDVVTIRTYDYDLSDLDSVDEVKLNLNGIIKRFSFDRAKIDEIHDNNLLPAENLNLQYEILDSIKSLESTIKEKDDGMIQKIMEIAMSKAAPQETAEVALMKTIMPTLINNPDALEKLMFLGEKNKKK